MSDHPARGWENPVWAWRRDEGRGTIEATWCFQCSVLFNPPNKAVRPLELSQFTDEDAEVREGWVPNLYWEVQGWDWTWWLRPKAHTFPVNQACIQGPTLWGSSASFLLSVKLVPQARASLLFLRSRSLEFHSFWHFLECFRSWRRRFIWFDGIFLPVLVSSAAPSGSQSNVITLLRSLDTPRVVGAWRTQYWHIALKRGVVGQTARGDTGYGRRMKGVDEKVPSTRELR